MAGRQCHIIDFRRVPGGDDQAPRVRVCVNLRLQVGDLVDDPTTGRRPRAPLRAVDWPKIAVLVRPFVPYRDAVRVEISNVGVALKKPEQLVDNRFQVKFLRRHHREAFGQIEAHLVAEDTVGPGACAVVFPNAVLTHPEEEIEILLHAVENTPHIARCEFSMSRRLAEKVR